MTQDYQLRSSTLDASPLAESARPIQVSFAIGLLIFEALLSLIRQTYGWYASPLSLLSRIPVPVAHDFREIFEAEAETFRHLQLINSALPVVLAIAIPLIAYLAIRKRWARYTLLALCLPPVVFVIQNSLILGLIAAHHMPVTSMVIFMAGSVYAFYFLFLLFLAAGTHWARYVLLVLCLMGIADFLPSDATEGSTLWALVMAWVGFFIYLGATILVFTPRASQWYRARAAQTFPFQAILWLVVAVIMARALVWQCSNFNQCFAFVGYFGMGPGFMLQLCLILGGALLAIAFARRSHHVRVLSGAVVVGTVTLALAGCTVIFPILPIPIGAVIGYFSPKYAVEYVVPQMVIVCFLAGFANYQTRKSKAVAGFEQ